MRWKAFILNCCFILACPPLSSPCAYGQHNLNIGIIEFIPLMTFANNEPGGLIFEYAQDIIRAAELTPRYHLVSINRSLEQLRGDHLDLVLTLFKTPERESFIRFSSLPILSFGSGFCTNAAFQKKPLNLSSRLVHVRGTVIPPELRKLELVPVTGEKAQIRMLQMLIKGRVQAVYSPQPEILIMAAHQAMIKAELSCYELKDHRMPVYLGYSRKLPLALVQKLESALQQKLQIESFEGFLRKRMIERGISPPIIHMIDASDLPGP
jgi:hypothetical protein